MGPADGARCLLDGFALLGKPGIRPLVVAPVLISLCVLVPGIWFAVDLALATGPWIEARMAGWVLEWFGWLATLVQVLTVVLALALALWLFSLLVTIIAGPFLGALSARVEALETGRPPADLRPWWHAVLAGLGREGRKLLYHLPRLLGVFVLTLVPPVNLVAPAVWLLFGAWMMAVQFIDLPVDNRGDSFARLRELLGRRRMAALGFGAVTAAGLAVPVVNLAVVPAAAAGATLWYLRSGAATDP